MITSQLDNTVKTLTVEIKTNGIYYHVSKHWSITLSKFIASNGSVVDLRTVCADTRTTICDLDRIFTAVEENGVLQSLEFEDNKVVKSEIHAPSEDCPYDFARSLIENTSLTRLVFKNIRLSDCMQALAWAIGHNKTLQTLSIAYDEMTEEDLSHLFDGLLHNSTIVDLRIPRKFSGFSHYLPLMAHIAKNKANKEKSVHTNQIGELLASKERIIQLERENEELRRLEKLFKEMKQRVRSVQTQNKSLKLSSEGLKREAQTLKDHINTFSNSHTLLQEEIQQVREENAKLTQQIEQLKTNGSIGYSIDIPYNEITLEKRIGDGGYGEIFKAQWHDQNIAVKKIKLADIDPSRVDNLIHESRTVMRLHHKHVVLSMGTISNPDTTEIMLVMEYMKHGSLEDLLFKRRIKLQRHQVIQLALDIAKGLNYLHCLDPKIVHRDIKCGNILLYYEGSRAKISDFGTARFLNKNSLAKTCHGGTLGYFAPEILEEEEYNEKADVYSFGIVLLVLATSNNNLPTMRDATKLRNRINDMLNASSCMADNEPYRMLVHDCCKINPVDRPSMKQCIEVLKGLRQKRV